MDTICCFIHSEFNNSLKGHISDQMSEYQELNQSLQSMHVIWHTVQNGHFYHPFENKDNIFRVKGVSDLSYELCYFVDNAVNRCPKKYGHL